MRLSSIFGDNMVLQRNEKIHINGTADCSQVSVKWKGSLYLANVNEKGSWKLELPECQAGGPYEMTLRESTDGDVLDELVIKNILVGDVWLLGGQSNMELPISRTLDLYEDEVRNVSEPDIRYFDVPKVHTFGYVKNMIDDGAWKSISTDTIMSVSAIGYFFAKEIKRITGVPVGLIQTAIGGTPVEAWMSEESLHEFVRYDAQMFECAAEGYEKAVSAREQIASNRWYSKVYAPDDIERYMEDEVKNVTGPKDSLMFVNELSVPCSFRGTELDGYSGSVWFRYYVELNDMIMNSEGVTKLRMGTIIDADDVYINGIKIGHTDYRYPPRNYTFDRNVLHAGLNVIYIRFVITGTCGSFVSGKRYQLELGDYIIDLTGKWSYEKGVRLEAAPQTTFFQYKPAGDYNAMIYPLQYYNIKGVCFYQGESNTDDVSEYDLKFEKVVSDWRKLWKKPELPFLYVQLANYSDGDESSEGDGWAYLRNLQNEGLKINNTAMVVTTDIGEYNDLHPLNKKEVAHRLALCAENDVYGNEVVCSGPVAQEADVSDNEVIIRFSNTADGLIAGHVVTKPAGEGIESKTTFVVDEVNPLHPSGFEVCGADGVYYEGTAEIKGDTIVVKNGRVTEPKGVRYAWRDYPKRANLYNSAGLPASLFILQVNTASK